MYADIRSLTKELATVIKRGSERVRTRSLLVSADRDSVLLRVCDWAITGGQDASIPEDETLNMEVLAPYVIDEDDGGSESESQTTDSLDGDESTFYNSSFDRSGRTSPDTADTKQSFFDDTGSPDDVTATLPRSPITRSGRTRTVSLRPSEREEQVDILRHQNDQLEEDLQQALEQNRNNYLVHLRQERANWKGRFDILKGGTRDTELKLHSSEAARHRLQKELLDAAREREIMHAQLEEEHSEQSRLKRRLADTHSQLRQRCSELEDLVVRINAAAEEATSRLEAERDSALAANVIARHTISMLEKEKAEGRTLALDIWDEYERLRASESSVRVTEKERDDALALASELRNRVSELNEELQATHSKREVLEQEVHWLQHEATRQVREAEEEEETRRLEVERQAELEASRKRMQQMLEEESKLKQQAVEEERKKKEAEERAMLSEQEEQERREQERRNQWQQATMAEEERCRRRDEENWNLSFGQLWSSQRAIHRFYFVLKEFETTQFSEAKPLTPNSVPWPVLISPTRFYVSMLEDWTLADKFFDRARRSLPFDAYRDLISRTRQTFHPDRWRSRNLLNTVMDEPLRAVMEDSGNKVSQAVNRLYQDMLDRSS
ncbi:hypothetical protein IW261DRAFT_1372351 [Armillaria novae-zelandiae]|uniref:Uncharacterized protein n=1 Tax=Armillaria novae-zelandiae TaxID=153914 RepID=A0AA39NS08_9AGAR|nr:hypothetical protein IW261DRAFT_1372351 [Armillaria novae-zelandiae]